MSQEEGDTLKGVLHKIGVAASSLPRGFLGTLNALGEGAGAGDLSLGNLNRTPARQAAIDKAGQDIQQGISNIGVKPTPGDPAEKYLEAGGEAIGALPLGGPLGPETSVARAMLTAAGGGVGGQAAADFAGDNPVSRIAGALAGGGLVGATKALEGNARSLAQKATADIQPIDLALGEQAQAESKAVGMPQTVAQALPNAPSLLKVQEALANSGHAPETTSILNRQPAIAQMKAKEAVAALPGQQTNELAANAQTQAAATDAVKAGYKQAGQAFKQALGGAAPQLPDSLTSQFDSWLANFSKQNPHSNVGKMAEDVREAIANPEAQAPKASAGPQILNAQGQPMAQVAAQKASKFIPDALQLKQAVDDSLEGFGPRRLNTPSVGATESKALFQIRQQLNSLFAKGAPELNKANQAYEDVVQQTVNPMKESITGKVAGTAGLREGQSPTNKVFQILDRGTTPGGYSDILTLEKDLRAHDPQAFPSAVKTHLAEKVAQASKTVSGELKPSFLGSLYDSIYGTEKAQQGLRDQLVGVARSQGLPDNALYPGFTRLINAIGRASKRPEDVANLTRGQVEASAGQNPLSNVLRVVGFMPFKAVAHGVEGYYRALAYKKLDEVMSSPKGIKLLQDLAKNDPMGKYGQSAIQTFLTATESAQQEPQQ